MYSCLLSQILISFFSDPPLHPTQRIKNRDFCLAVRMVLAVRLVCGTQCCRTWGCDPSLCALRRQNNDYVRNTGRGALTNDSEKPLHVGALPCQPGRGPVCGRSSGVRKKHFVYRLGKRDADSVFLSPKRKTGSLLTRHRRTPHSTSRSIDHGSS